MFSSFLTCETELKIIGAFFKLVTYYKPEMNWLTEKIMTIYSLWKKCLSPVMDRMKVNCSDDACYI